MGVCVRAQGTCTFVKGVSVLGHALFVGSGWTSVGHKEYICVVSLYFKVWGVRRVCICGRCVLWGVTPALGREHTSLHVLSGAPPSPSPPQFKCFQTPAVPVQS